MKQIPYTRGIPHKGIGLPIPQEAFRDLNWHGSEKEAQPCKPLERLQTQGVSRLWETDRQTSQNDGRSDQTIGKNSLFSNCKRRGGRS